MTLNTFLWSLSCQSETGFVFKKGIDILLLDVFVFVLLSTKCLLLLLFCSLPTHTYMSMQILQMGIPISVMTIVQAFSQHLSNSTSTW